MNWAAATRRGQGDGTAIADVTAAGAGHILTAALLKLRLARTPQKSNFETRHYTVSVSQTAQATNGIRRITYGDKWQLLVGCQQRHIRELQTVQEKQREKELP